MADAWMAHLAKFDLVGLHTEAEKVGYRVRVANGYTFDLEYQGGLEDYYQKGLAIKRFEDTPQGREDAIAFLATVGKEAKYQVLFTFDTPEGNFHKITVEDVANSLCNALEGGSNSWYMIENVVEPSSWDYVDELEHSREGGHWFHDYPLNPGGGIWFSSSLDKDDDAVLLNAETIQQGLQVLREKYQWHLVAMATQNGDADTGDAFLQSCLYKEIVYG